MENISDSTAQERRERDSGGHVGVGGGGLDWTVAVPVGVPGRGKLLRLEQLSVGLRGG